MKTKILLKILPLLALAFVAACGESGDDAPHSRGREFFMADGSQFHGTSTLNCSNCHSGSIANCTRCHFGPDGARVPDGVTWTHGTIPHNDPGLVAVEVVCNRCHSMTRGFDGVPASCHDCH
jgi:hypothetical protein